MIHLLEFESFSNFLLINENDIKGGIPVYNEDIFMKTNNAKPAMMVKSTELVSTLTRLLEDQENGDIEKIIVIAEIPTQGKNAPQYVKDDVAAERDRMAKRKYALYGSRIERADRPEEEEYTDAINIFVDSEFIVKGVVNKLGKDYVIAIPESKSRKAEASASNMEYYTVYIDPKQVDEVFFTPAK